MKHFVKLLLAVGMLFLLGCSGGGDDSDSSTDTVRVVDYDPVASAGLDRSGITTKDMSSVQTHELIFLDGSASYGTSFEWNLVSKPSESASFSFISRSTKSTGVYGDTAGDYVLSFKATNADGKSSSTNVTVTLIEDDDNDGIVNSDDLDRDGDGFLNTNDLFPDNKVSHYDFDQDGSGNYYESDVDGDGVADTQDDYPLTKTKTAFSIFEETKETLSSYNQNDGISISETTSLSAPLSIKGKLYSSDYYGTTKTDSDFYSISMNTGNYSIVVDELNTSMDLIVSVVNAQGQSLSSITTDISSLDKYLTSVYVPSNDTYYIVVTDAQGRSASSWDYTIKMFSDSDMDGLSDALEQAIDSNHNTPDSDGDGILDFIEYTYHVAKGDIDSDGIPNWWDYDSDNDGIADSVEFYTSSDNPTLSTSDLDLLNDIDGDGIPNFLDTDSDDNGISDKDEAGSDYSNPLDTDGDYTPDYLDVDNDNDGLLDTLESLENVNKSIALPGENKSFAESILISSVKNTDLGVEKVCAKDTEVEVELLNVPEAVSSVVLTFKGLSESINQNTTVSSSGLITFTCPDSVESGLVEFFVTFNDSERTISEEMVFVEDETPLITSASYDSSSSRLNIEGKNLNYDLTITLNDQYSYSNKYGSSTSVSYYSYSQLESGMLSVSNSAGTSNQVYVAITKDMSVYIDSPDDSLDMSLVDLSLDDESYTPNSYGNVSVPVKVDSPTIVTAFINESGEDDDYVPYLYGVALPDSYSLNIDATSTAVALVYTGLGISSLVDEDELGTVLSNLAELSEVKALASRLESDLASNYDALLSQSSGLTSASKEALLAAAEHMSDSFDDGTYTKKSSPARAGLFGEPATVTPSTTDGISVYERDDTGNINIYNDTQMYLSARVTDMKGRVLQDHISSYFSSNAVGPQGYGLLFWAYTAELNLPAGKNCNVEIVTPGVDTEFEPKMMPHASSNKSTRAVFKYLAFRTLVERVAWPALSEIFGEYMDKHTFINILYTYSPALVDTVVNEISKGEMSAAMKKMLDLLWQDFFSQPPGPITTAIAKKVIGEKLENMAQEFAQKIITKVAKKIGMKTIPVIGQLSVAYDVAGHLNNGLNAAGALYDLNTKDSMINFSVVFPLSIKEVSPSKIIPDGSNRTFYIDGTGFSEVKEHWYNISGVKPKVTLTDKDGQSIYVNPAYINTNGTWMRIEIPGDYLSEDIKGPIDVEIHHPTFNPNSKVTKVAAIEIVGEVSLTSISPSTGGTGVEVTLYGSGFSEQSSNNEVSFGGSAVLISSVSQDSIKVIVPSTLAEGEHDVKVRVKSSDGTWGDWSNSLKYTVELSSISMTVCDNGGAKDDAFQLYVNGALEGSVYATSSSYCKTFNPTVNVGTNTAMLQGIEAPDGVGTYSISFSGVTVSGAALSGSDLTPGVTKNYTFEVTSTTSSAPRRMLTQPYIVYPYAEKN